MVLWAVDAVTNFLRSPKRVTAAKEREQLKRPGSDSNFGLLDETRSAYFALTPGLSPVYAVIKATNCFNSFLRGWKTVETASSLLTVGTRLKPGVTEKKALTLGFDSREGFQISSRWCTSCESNAPSI